MFDKVISGGQTGVDRAALDVAFELGIPSAGWCPQGRRAEDGRIDDCYPLKETQNADYTERTEWNVRDSDGTLVLVRGRPTEGTALTIEVAQRLGKPCLVLNLSKEPQASQVCAWARNQQVRVLNVAGPRESKSPGIYQEAKEFLRRVLAT